MKLALILLVPLMVFSAWHYTRREENENRLELVASEVALRDVEVSCPGFWTRLVEITPNAGWVDFEPDGRPAGTTSLSSQTCSSLERIWRAEQGSFGCVLGGGCDRATLEAVHGIVTLAHESWHLRGIRDEARTQCYAVQTTELVARRLGVPEREAHMIALRVAADDASAGQGEYHSRECRPGGKYDLHPATPDWPSG